MVLRRFVQISVVLLALGLVVHQPGWSVAADKAVPLTRLTAKEISARMQALPTWRTDGQQLTCTYSVANFIEAVNFVNRLIAPAEMLQHHPDLKVTYNQVGITLTTHDAGGLTTLDFQLAEAILTLRQGQPGCLIP
jgi:4a-hydroxytetrahydrobiopterin dehydratase